MMNNNLNSSEKFLKAKITNKSHKTSCSFQILSLVQKFQGFFHTNCLDNTGCKIINRVSEQVSDHRKQYNMNGKDEHLELFQ